MASAVINPYSLSVFFFPVSSNGRTIATATTNSPLIIKKAGRTPKRSMAFSRRVGPKKLPILATIIKMPIAAHESLYSYIHSFIKKNLRLKVLGPYIQVLMRSGTSLICPSQSGERYIYRFIEPKKREKGQQAGYWSGHYGLGLLGAHKCV